MRHFVCFNFLPKRRISCPRGPRSHGFCGLTVVQAALNYVARSYLKSEVQQSFIPLSPHSWLRHIGATYSAKRVPSYSLLWAACYVQGQEGEGGAHRTDGGAGAVDQGDLSHRGAEDLSRSRAGQYGA